jgi:hypothetical protein
MKTTRKIEKGDLVKFIGKGHKVLETDKNYVVYDTGDKGLRVHSETGFVGIPYKYIELVLKV